MATALTEKMTGISLDGLSEVSLTTVPVQTQPRLSDINLLLSVEQPNELTQRNIQVFAGETIRDLKIQLRKKEFFTNQHCLVFGQRELLEDETIGQVAAAAGGGNFLHVLAKLSEIDNLEVTTDKRKTVLKSDLSCASPLLLCGRVMETGTELTKRPSLESRHGDPIVHLIIRRSAKVHWHHLKGARFEMRITADVTVDDVKRKLEEVSEGFEADEHAVVKEGHTLQPGMSLSELGVESGDVLEIVEVPLCLEEFPDPVSPKRVDPKAEMSEAWEGAKDALAHGVRPKLASVGTGGSYFISALEGGNLAVFKPYDEEPRAPNNPKGHRETPTGDGLRKGVRPGEGATREVIAFMLDHGRFSGVPPTTMASLSDVRSATHRKIGSFQQFVQHDVDCEEMGPSNFPVHEVHKICILDIRLGNTDRNAGNILASQKSGQWVLTPIDHGYCLPDSFEDLSFEWMNWRQAKVPFDAEIQSYISDLSAERDLKLLAEAGLHLRRDCVRVFRVCTMLLKKSLSHGLTAYDLANIMCRQSLTMSPLEKLHKRAVKMTLGGGSAGRVEGLDEELYLKTMSDVIDEYLEETAVVL